MCSLDRVGLHVGVVHVDIQLNVVEPLGDNVGRQEGDEAQQCRGHTAARDDPNSQVELVREGLIHPVAPRARIDKEAKPNNCEREAMPLRCLHQGSVIDALEALVDV